MAQLGESNSVFLFFRLAMASLDTGLFIDR